MGLFHRHIVQKFLVGKASKKEVEQVANYVFSEGIAEDIDRELCQVFENDNKKITALDTRESWDNISNNLHSSTKPPKKVNWIYNFYKLAAAITILMVVALFTYQHVEKAEVAPEDANITAITKSTDKGQKLHIRLPDGSMVILNANSEITYTRGFADGNRAVAISGEAFFEVKSDSTKPFIVSTHHLNVEVLGTSFNVKQTTNEAQVALVEGKVKLTSNSGDVCNMQPGQVSQYTRGTLKTLEQNMESIIGWKEGWLYFEKNSLDEIIFKLENWYGVEIDTGSINRKKYHYTGKFKNKSLREVLEGISFVMSFNFEIKGNQVTIHQ